jgi:peroxiredoxin
MRIFFMITALLLCGTLSAQNEQPKAETIAKVGEMVPDFTVTMFDGKQINIASLRGKVVLIGFWATWCPPCNMEMSRVQKDIFDKFAGKDFMFLPISRGETRDVVAKWLEKKGYKFNVGLDPDKKIWDKFAVSGVPRSYLIDRSGKIVEFELGYEAESFDKMVDKIAQMLK